MKKRKVAKRTSPGKRKKVPKTVDEYMAGVPEPARDSFIKLRALVREAVPATASEVISYGIPAFRDDKVLVWIAAFAKHVSLFPTASVLHGFREELSPYKTSKGTVQFPLDKSLPATLIKKMVKIRVGEAKRK